MTYEQWGEWLQETKEAEDGSIDRMYADWTADRARIKAEAALDAQEGIAFLEEARALLDNAAQDAISLRSRAIKAGAEVERLRIDWEEAERDKLKQRRHRKWALEMARSAMEDYREAYELGVFAEAAVDRLQRALRAAETELEQLRFEARLRKSWREDTDREKQRAEKAEAERDKLQADAILLDECVDGMIADREYFEELARKAEAERDKLAARVKDAYRKGVEDGEKREYRAWQRVLKER